MAGNDEVNDLKARVEKLEKELEKLWGSAAGLPGVVELAGRVGKLEERVNKLEKGVRGMSQV